MPSFILPKLKGMMMITSLDNNHSGIIGWILSYCSADKMVWCFFFVLPDKREFKFLLQLLWPRLFAFTWQLSLVRQLRKEKVRCQGHILSHKLIKFLICYPPLCTPASVFLHLSSNIITTRPNVTFRMGWLQALNVISLITLWQLLCVIKTDVTYLIGEGEQSFSHWQLLLAKSKFYFFLLANYISV